MYHLHNHSHYSLLDGLIKIEDMIERVKEIGADAVAITDHANITVMPELFKKCEAAGIKPIIGCEFYVVDNPDERPRSEKRYHLNVLAKSWQGVVSIMEHLTVANRQNYRRPRLSWDQCMDFHDCIVTTACALGPLQRDDYREIVDRLHTAYGEDLYFELLAHEFIDQKLGLDPQKLCNYRAMELSSELGIPVIATNDAHYTRAEDTETHEVLLAIQTRRKMSDPNRWTFGDGQLYLKDTHEMVQAMRSCGIPDDWIEYSLLNTKGVVDKCNVVLPEFPISLPSPIEGGKDDEKVFAEMLLEGYKTKGIKDMPNPQEYQDRMIYEISVIKRMGFVRYFLMIADIINWAEGHEIMIGPARGSAAGSLVCYLLGITKVDPLKHGLYFERFLNPDRLDFPDIDVDVEKNRRHEVVGYIRGKYGEEHTALISTYTVLGVKNTFRDVASCFGVTPKDINELSKLIEPQVVRDSSGEVKETLDEWASFELVPELRELVGKEPRILQHTRKLEGVVRNAGVHAAGIVASTQRLDQLAAVETRAKGECICWDKRLCEDPFGLIKMDMLGLSTLSVLSHATKLIRENHGVDINLNEISLRDPKVQEAFARGDGVGIFQFENKGVQSLLKSIEDGCFETVTAITALYRPGPLGAKDENGNSMVDKYKAIARGEEYPHYLSPELEPILSPTRGQLVYQEQMMRIFSDLGGFTWAESDKMRKICAKKLGEEAFKEHKGHFVEGCVKNGIEEGVAGRIFDEMVSFAAYSFNKSHAVAYAMISWQSQYIKQHYPVEYMAAMLSYTTKQEKIPEYVRECDRLGIKVNYPDINLSAGEEWGIADGEIVGPLSAVKGVGPKAVETIIEARNSGGVFLSREDMVNRINRRACNKRVQETLWRAGAFMSLGDMNPDPDERALDLNQLLTMYTTLPKIRKGSGEKKLKDIWQGFVDRIHEKVGDPTAVMEPVSHARPSLMIVNNCPKKEDKPLGSDMTKHMIDELKSRGIPFAEVHYTPPIKMNIGNPREMTDEQIAEWIPFLKEEIAIIKPKLILVCSGQFVNTFTSEKGVSIRNVNGQLFWNEEFGCYVMWVVSPQWAKFDNDVYDDFTKALDIVGEIYSD